MALGRTAKLYTGAEIPLIGLGTWLSKPDEVRKAVEVALEVGYRHIDGAYIYQNEHEVGQALSNSKVPRRDIWLTSKLWNTGHRPEYVRPSLEVTLKNFHTDYLDLYLIHWPVSFKPSTSPQDIPFIPSDDHLFPKNAKGNMDVEEVDPLLTWREMEALVDAGLVKHIGLSNFTIPKIQYILDNARIRPAVLQVELHPAFQQKRLLEFCAKENIHVTAYSPLGNNIYGEKRIVDDPAIVEVAKKLGKSPAQVCISWAAQRGTSVVPKSVTPSRIKENFQDFTLSPQDFAAVSALGAKKHRYNNPGPHWPAPIFEDDLPDDEYKSRI